MYNVQIDENMFFTGSYVIIGTLENGVEVETLPPSENSLCYKLVEGNWEYSQDKYEELEAAKIAKEEELAEEQAYQESISNEVLKAENQLLTEQVTMLDQILTIMLEEILPNLMGE